MNEHSLHAPYIFNFYRQVIKTAEKPPSFERFEQLRKQYLQNRQLLTIEDLGAGAARHAGSQRSIASIARHSLTPARYAPLLFHCARFAQAATIVELGTSLGISTLYLAEASPSGRVYTLEGSNAIADVATQTFRQQGCANIDLRRGNINQTLPALLREISTLDVCFIDANHRYETTVHYFRQCKAKAHQQSIFIFDDIYWSAGMRRAWQEIRHDQDVSISIDLFKFGLVLFYPLQTKQHYTLMM